LSSVAPGTERLLLVDDEPGIRTTVSRALKQAGYLCDLAASGLDAKRRVEEEAYDLVISDIRMQGVSGIDLLRHIRGVSPDTPVILISAYATLDDAIQAIQLGGARDLVQKAPGFEDLLQKRVGDILETRRLKARLATLEAAQGPADRERRLIGRSPALREVLSLVDRIAPTQSTVLIRGESGTGKERVAREIHLASGRRDAAFVSINCGALPDELLESELFGHVKGSFTGAVSTKKGLFEVAHGGTLLLDEIGETSPAMQVKLLRVLQERTLRRVGGTEEIAVDVRVIAATNQDLALMVQERRFREDLFYRINVIPIVVPPLRDRPSDIPLLADHFLSRFRESMGKHIVRISDAAMTLLERYPWPGNVRELENVIERAVALELTGEVSPESMSREVRGTAAATPTDQAVELPAEGFDLEAHLELRRETFMRRALERASGVQSRAAAQVGMTFRSFRYFARKYGLTSGREATAETGEAGEE
jgi:two-component system response regulator PilR (NtrC family)